MRLIDADELKGLYDPENYEGHEPDENWDDVPRTFAEIRADIDDQPTVDAVPVVRCKNCKHYELDSWANVNGIPLIVAHQICKRWGKGCKTDENGFCFMGEKVTE